jgi:E-phenylitaconyl-CoA hydratase
LDEFFDAVSIEQGSLKSDLADGGKRVCLAEVWPSWPRGFPTDTESCTELKGRLPVTTVLYQVRDHVARIMLKRPEAMNAMNGQMIEDLSTIWERFWADDAARVGILTGEGRAFCVGADVKEAPFSQDPDRAFLAGKAWGSIEHSRWMWKPLVAAIRGHCLGSGLTLALTCDVRIAADDAQFGFPEVKLGLPTVIGSIRLARTISAGAALELLLTGRSIPAERALAIGLVEKVVPGSQLERVAWEVANEIAANSPVAVRLCKELAVRTPEMSFEDAVRFSEALRVVALSSADAHLSPLRSGDRRRRKQAKEQPVPDGQ